eukprot:NODE_1523_length_1119_cov_394.195489.p1 GENE.NODE_1523_length_1119_cov_394.195489~~NODE_1523_length_1119_cov_394.195489.p1  ORF type:complete len:233 (+),score=75.96 NODE_1523_length_1119_cov_394.195489:3-701(+)
MGGAGAAMRTAHAYVVWPAAATVAAARLPQELKSKVHELISGEEEALELEVVQPAVASCPAPVPQVEMLSAAAQAAWHACASELSLVQVSFQTSTGDFEELVTALEILGDTEVVGGGSGFFLGRPAISQPELLHGPTHAEYKNLHSSTFDSHFPVICALAVLLLLALLKLAHVTYHRLGNSFAPLLLVISVFSGTVALPVAVGAWWYRQRKTAAAEGESPELEMTCEEDTVE